MSELLDLAARVVAWAREGEQVEAYVVRGRDTDVRAFGGEVESLSSAESAGIGVRVVAGSRQGFAYAGSLDEAALAETLAEARDNSGLTTPDNHVGLAEPDGVAACELDLWRGELAGFPAERKAALAIELERAVRGADPRVRQVRNARWGDSSVESALATSTGLSTSWRRTSCHLAVEVVAGEGSESQTAVGYSVGRAPEELDLPGAARDAVARSTRLLGARKPRSAHLTAVFEPKVTASVLAIIGAILDGESVLKGRSLFAGRLGEEVADPSVTLVDDPTDPDAYGAAPYDGEGLATRRNALVEGGVLRRFLYDSHSARRAGTTSTASALRAGYRGTPRPGARALLVQPGDLAPEQLLAKVGDGLLVQSISGVHSGVNQVSGDFSVGAVGLVIRGGELAEPVREVTVASTLQRMLTAVVAIGSDVERLPSSATGVTLAVADVSMSGA